MNIAAVQGNQTHEFKADKAQNQSSQTSFSSFLNAQTMSSSTSSKRGLVQQQESKADSTLKILASSDDHIMEMAGENFAAFLENLFIDNEDTIEPAQEDIKELVSVIQLLRVETGELNIRSTSESDIEELVEHLPQEVKAGIETFLQMFSNSAEPSNIIEDFSKPENVVSLLILLSQIDGEAMKKLDEPTFTKLFEFVNKQVDALEATTIIPRDIDVELIGKKMQQIMQQLFGKELHEQPNDNAKTDTRKEYLQSVFSRYFVEQNGMKNTANQQITHATQSIQTNIQTSTKVETVFQQVVSNVDIQAPMNKIQQFVLFVEQNGKQTVGQEQFIKEFQNILSRSQFGNLQDGQQKLLIKLYPEHLGSLRIEILQKDNLMTARIIASTAAAKDVLESQVQNLKQSFLSQNIQIEKVEIAHQQLQQSERFLQKDSQQNQDSEQQQKSETDNQDDSETKSSFVASLQEEILNLKV
ncbi:flagellar hook-length control protein FliK [Cytobacillus sp. S13-E01]|uniref:flagellar hook-length control protein FliK n=1 Tax=Cytobacillus sp. S13-E01 TaxID=3031326 RepID=UPI0023D82FD2|nr:flagellar hook-length control protein FliK [Cytobacillus sp. S13-E01]MDF0725184.1 flagellar hook-length control protein FliK [Cytobacillus sp. S13-E01]